MATSHDIWRERRLEIESLIEQAQELEQAAKDPDMSIAETTCFFAHATNLRVQALCLDNPATRPDPVTEPEAE